MARPFALVSVLLTAAVAFIIGLIAAGSLTTAPEVSQPELASATAGAREPIAVPALEGAAFTRPGAGLVNFADVAERINPAVVNIEATTRGESTRRRRQFETPPLDEGGPDRQSPLPVRPQSGSGFVIDSSGIILTNYHVIQSAERIVVKFSNGRSLPAHVIGIDPDTDIA